MNIIIKDSKDIEKMRAVCKLSSQVISMLEKKIIAGITTNQINDLCVNYIEQELNAQSAILNYNGFPKAICTSVNHVVCHGIPNDKPLKNGDIVNVDVTIIKDGYYGDTSKMFLIGNVKPWAKNLCDITQQCLYAGIKAVKPKARLGDIGDVIQNIAEKNGFSVVRDYCGHGIGTKFHEDPQVLHYGKKDTGIELVEGMIFTIEPMINQGTYEIKHMPDKWTVVTKDRKLSAQYEHTVLVTKDGFEVLTLRDEEKDF